MPGAPSNPDRSAMQVERRLELRSVIALSVGAMLGSGIFVLPGLAASMTGPSVWLAYLAAGICVIPAGLSKAELATAMPASGGTYVYVERTFGPLIGTVVGLGLWLSLLLKSTFALDGMAAYLEVLAAIPAKPTALVLLVGIIGLNIVGVRKVGKVQSLVVFTSMIALVLLALAGLPSVEPDNLSPAFTRGTAGFLAATAFVFVSYAGVTKVAAVAEEVRRPNRNLPLGILLSLLFAMIIYGVVVFVLVGNVAFTDLEGDLRPVHSLSVAVAGPVVGVVAAALGVLTMTSMANAGLLSSSRFPFAMSRDGLLPRFLERLHPSYLTPVSCIVLTGAVMAAFLVTLDVERIAKLASAFILMIYLIENLVVIVLRETAVQWYRPSYRAPIYPWLQVFGVLATCGLLYEMGLFSVIASGAVAVPGVAVYAFYSRHRTERRGVIGKLGPRDDIQPESARSSQTKQLARRDDHPACLVALIGHEDSPETLVEMGAALAGGGLVRVLHVTEIPEQTMPEAVREDDAFTRSTRRRIGAMAEERDFALEYVAIASRDVILTIHEHTQASGAPWLVMDWRPRGRGSFLRTTPLGWLTQRLTCDFGVFRDAGVRHFRKILALVEPGPHDALVASTADHLAALHGAELTLARFVADDTDLPLVQAQLDYLDQLRGLVRRQALCRIICGPSETATLVTESTDYDLIVLGAEPEKRFLGRLRSSLQEELNIHGGCSILRLRTSRTRSHDEQGVERRITGAAAADFDLASHVDSRLIGVHVAVTKKDALFDAFADTFAGELGEVSAKDVVAALWERERTQNTSVGDGVAMPHATLAAANRLYLGIFTLAAPMDYDAIDGKPVDVFFVTLGPPSDRQTHLRVLGGVARLVLETNMLRELRSANDAVAIIDAVKRVEAARRNPRP